MDPRMFERVSEFEWRIPAQGRMRVPGIIYASRELISEMDDKVGEQVSNVAMLPGICTASYAMPDAHWGYGFPIGGVAAFDPDQDGVISAGGVGFDISCGVRSLDTGLGYDDIEPFKEKLADALFQKIPAGVGSTGSLTLNGKQMDAMLSGGARWAVQQGYGEVQDLARTEEHGCMAAADPSAVSEKAKQRQRREVGTLGSGNHYLEVQRVAEIFDEKIAQAFGIRQDGLMVSIHCGSRGLGHQIGTDYLKSMAIAASRYGIELPDRELACAPIRSGLGQQYLGAMRAGINCALANRQVITHLARQAFQQLFPEARLRLLYDVSHNTCKEETCRINGSSKRLFVHRKGATRSFGPADPEMKTLFGRTGAGQPVLIGGSMGTASYILSGTDRSMQTAFGSACHGAGRRMSRHQALKQWRGGNLVEDLRSRGILIRARSLRGVAEEAPGAYKDVTAVVDAAQAAGLALKVARLVPVICVKG